jgi:hypothetical protein
MKQIKKIEFTLKGPNDKVFGFDMDGNIGLSYCIHNGMLMIEEARKNGETFDHIYAPGQWLSAFAVKCPKR